MGPGNSRPGVRSTWGRHLHAAPLPGWPRGRLGRLAAGLPVLIALMGAHVAQASTPDRSGFGTSRSEEGSDLPDLLHIEPFFGPAYAHLAAFNDDDFLITDPAVGDLVQNDQGGGFAVGGAAYLRLLLFTVGARFAHADYGDFSLNTVMAEAGIRPSLWFFEPYFRLAFGYAWMGGIGGGPAGSHTEVFGFAAGAALGLDLRLAQIFSLGFGVHGDLLNLSRQTDPGDAAVVSVEDGSALGVQGRLELHLTLHI